MTVLLAFAAGFLVVFAAFVYVAGGGKYDAAWVVSLLFGTALLGVVCWLQFTPWTPPDHDPPIRQDDFHHLSDQVQKLDRRLQRLENHLSLPERREP